MNEGLQIILNRMETHPKEFLESTRWTHIYSKYKAVLTDEEISAYEAKAKEISRKAFTDAVMLELLSDEKAVPTPPEGSLRYNTSTLKEEVYIQGEWCPIGPILGAGGGGGGSVGGSVGGGGGSGMVIINDANGTHTFTSSGTYTTPKAAP